MSNEYFKRVIPEPVRVLGLSLRPLSLGRYRLLRRFDVAFVAEDTQEARGDDLILGVLICSMKCAEFVEWAASPDFYKDVQKWGRKVCGLRWLGWFHRLFGKGFDFLEKVLLFKNYIESGLKFPTYTEEQESDGGSSSAHWSHNLEVVLRSELGWSADEIAEEPLSKAIADYYKWAENKGMIRMLSDAEVEAAVANAQAMGMN